MNDLERIKKLAGITAPHDMNDISDETDSADDLCPACDGSGEGMYPGASCHKCKGHGTVQDRNLDDYMDDPRDRDYTEEGYTVTPGIDRERYTDLSSEGLEGPFTTKSGKVVYYDPKEGKYYDRDTDMYIPHDEFHAINNESLDESEIVEMRKLAGIVDSTKSVMEEYDYVGQIKHAIGDIHPLGGDRNVYRDEVLKVYPRLQDSPEFDNWFNTAYDEFYGIRQDSDEEPEEDYADYTMRQGELGNPDRFYESAPPGMEDLVMKLKKEYPGDHSKAFATAWSIYNKKHGKVEEMNIETGDDGYSENTTNAMNRFADLINSWVDPVEALDVVTRELSEMGLDADEIDTVAGEIRAEYADQFDDETEPSDGMSDSEADADALASAGFGTDEDYGDFGGDDMYEEVDTVEEDYDLNNGYDSERYANGQDYFPDGADSPVTKSTGASGARQGDNPEQKKVEVAEMHKELVYSYRKFLKENSKK